jgi:hypothetical protein
MTVPLIPAANGGAFFRKREKKSPGLMAVYEVRNEPSRSGVAERDELAKQLTKVIAGESVFAD